ncbi:MAG: metalloregulator ArsR/SmtB family transcription factor [Actinomycetota bacterium]|nr:metalloregulator ArsR/SmtB family transcription factor [Actinomycetota bacterium]
MGSVGVERVAELFKVLGSTTRLSLIEILMTSPATVGELVSGSGLSQPLVSQHLRTLRQVGVVSAQRRGREVVYALADDHVVHVVQDAIAHMNEEHLPTPAERGPEATPTERRTS